MKLLPLRLSPGTDLRKSIEEALQAHGQSAAFVLSGIGSLTQGKLRYAAQQEETTFSEPLEVLSLSGSVSPEGAHLHVSVATGSGEVYGGHLCYGNAIRTTAEILVVLLPEWQFSREHDPNTGYKELVFQVKGTKQNAA